ncbi:hypothetical protein BS17DRAFT_797900 [Gyrodon lividus]|nr:hypothetical protein BS17DRAFT_797900 [Gyrodon lividus]
MSKPEVMCFGDGHYQHVIFGLGPYIADYEEQVLLSCIVCGWCPKSEYGIVRQLVPFTNDFPGADIHELLSPDLLHQIIKGTFKDHLIDWVKNYLKHKHSTSKANTILDDIDHRCVSLWV